MNKIFSILLFAGIIPQFTYTIDTKKRIYRQEATQKLQEKLDTVKSDSDIIKPDFLRVVDQLITEGANPNISGGVGVPAYHAEHGFIEINKNTLLYHLVSGADRIHNPDEALIEKVTKNALAHRADPNTVFEHAVVFGLPGQVQSLIEYGADVLSKNPDSGETSLTILERIINREKEEISQMVSNQVHQSFISKQQADIARMEQIRDILKAAEQKK